MTCTQFPAVVIRLAGPRYAGKSITAVFTATALGAALGSLASITGNISAGESPSSVQQPSPRSRGRPRSVLVPKIREGAHEPLSLRQTARDPGVLRVALGWSLVIAGPLRRPHLHRGLPDQPRPPTSALDTRNR